MILVILDNVIGMLAIYYTCVLDPKKGEEENKEVYLSAMTFPLDDCPFPGKCSWKSHMSFQLASH